MSDAIDWAMVLIALICVARWAWEDRGWGMETTWLLVAAYAISKALERCYE